MKKSFIAVIAAVMLFLTGCSIANTAPDTVGVHYDAGPFSSTTFENCIDPSQRNIDGPADSHFYYPAGQRFYVFDNSDNQGKDSAAFTAPSKDTQQLTIGGQMRFELNTNCDTLREFHEKIGLKDDWTSILKTYLAQPLNRAITDATQQFLWTDLYSNIDGAQGKWEAKVKELLPSYIEQSAGGDYFINIDVTLQRPDVTENLRASLENVAKAVLENQAQQERNVQVQSELASIRDLVAVLGPDGYNVYQAIKDGKIQVLPIPAGTNVAIPVR